MNRIASACIGVAGAAWYSYLYYYFFKVFFINVSLEPVIAPCRENLSLPVCRGATIVLLWLMDLPVGVMLFLTFSILLSFAATLFPRLQVLVGYVVLGYVISYLLVLVVMYPELTVSWYTVATVVTHSVIIAGSFWLAGHLTRRATGRLRRPFA